jgi:predicted dehydrogenase
MKHYGLAGASSRGLLMYAKPIYEQYADTSRLVGVFDTNSIRAQYTSQECGHAPVFKSFEEMLDRAHPDTIIVTTVDRYHHEYIVKALEAGCEVITEKPMTIDAEKCRAILSAEIKTGKKITVTFNCRFEPYVVRIKELVKEGAVGQVLSVDLKWFLDTSHGADYFRRWHRRIENSGGLLVHKATHHFDMVNWWIEDSPQTVYAFGNRRFYGPTRKERGERCSTCSYQNTCEFFVDFASVPILKALYFDAEREDGYFRDGCVFSDEINIYDNMSATIKYQSGTLLSYSLIAHAPYEGWQATINGTGGRLEIQKYESGPLAAAPVYTANLFNRKGELISYAIPKAVGGHGGADERLLERLFGRYTPPDPLGQMAGSQAGIMSVLIGVAANKSIQSGQPVIINDLLLG